MNTAQPRLICIAANTCWYLFNFRSNLISRLIQDGYEVVAISPPDKYVEKVSALGAEFLPLSLDNTGTNPIKELLTIGRIVALLHQSQPSLILSFTPKINIYFAFAARLLRIPIVANISGLGRAFGGSPLLAWIARRLYGVALRIPAAVMFQNEEDRSSFVNARLVEPGRTDRMPGSGVNTERFHPRLRKPSTSGELVFLLSARLLWAKGVGEYVEAARIVKRAVPRTRFLLLGFVEKPGRDGVSLETLTAWCEDGTVEYLGAVDDVVSVYSTVDCVVLPSYYREGVPRSLLEGASMGLPLIAARNPGSNDAVEHGITGYLCKPKDAEDLANSMLRLIELPLLERRAMGDAGREKMLKEFDEKFVINKYMCWVKRCLDPQS
ncbi:MAG: glycosyltransferase family 4 protein [Nitrospiraceae bacterium]